MTKHDIDDQVPHMCTCATTARWTASIPAHFAAAAGNFAAAGAGHRRRLRARKGSAGGHHQSARRPACRCTGADAQPWTHCPFEDLDWIGDLGLETWTWTWIKDAAGTRLLAVEGLRRHVRLLEDATAVLYESLGEASDILDRVELRAARELKAPARAGN